MPTFNTTDPKPGYVYDSAVDTWFPLVGIAPASQVDRWTKTAAGGETSLSGNDDNAVSLSYTSGTEQVYLNGVLLVRGQDYTATNGTTITGLTALAASDVAEVVTFNPSNILTTDSILDTDFAAKGDLISASAASTPIRVPVGTNGQVLKANSATTSGLEWGTVDADIEGVTAGTGISGGGTSGTVTITNSMATAIDAKGDLVAGTAADTFSRLAVGSNDQVLTADSSTATGLKWATAASPALTLSQIASGNFNSGTSLSLTGLTQDYLELHIYGITTTATNIILTIKPNNDGGGLCDYVGGNNAQGSTVGSIRTQNGVGFKASSNSAQLFSDTNNYYIIRFQNCKASGFTTYSWTAGFVDNGSSNANVYGNGIFKSATQLTSINIAGQSGQTFNGTGTYALYGG